MRKNKCYSANKKMQAVTKRPVDFEPGVEATKQNLNNHSFIKYK